MVLEIPSDVRITGICERDSKLARLTLTWPDAIFSITFGFDDLIDSWFVSQFSIQYDTESPAFQGRARRKYFFKKTVKFTFQYLEV